MTLDRRTILAFVITGAFVLALCMLVLKPPTAADEFARNILLVMFGALVGLVQQVFSFDFGSSAGSKAKDDALISAAETPQMARRREAEAEPTVPMTVTVEKQELEAEIKP